MRTLRTLTLVTVVLGAGADALAQPQWSQLTPANAPSSRQDHNMCEAAGNTILLFGGALDKTTVPLNDTWSWDGTNWTPLNPVTTPTGVTGHAMAWDPMRNVVVMFGGSTVPAGQVNYSDETWEWDGIDWTLMTPATKPPARDWSNMVFDPGSNSIIMFAGRDSNNKPAGSYVPYNDTWSWDGTNWTQLTPATTTPAVRHGHQVEYDQNLGQVVVVGGQRPGTTYSDTWTWTGSDWVDISPASGPGTRVFHGMEFDIARGVMVLHGGKNTANNTIYTDTWEFDGTAGTWTQVSTSGPAYGWYPMVYDASRQEMLVQGGSPSPSHSSSDGTTWSFGDAIWTDLGNDLAGALGSPTLAGQGSLAAGNVVTLTLANAAVNSTSGLFIGASNASLPFFGGTLVPSPNVLVIIPTGPTGGYTLPGSYPAGVPAGFPLYFQVWVLDATGPQGHTASNALTATTM